MIPADDRYRMVEDEFLCTAQRFTTHLHRAEYDRLKARARSNHALTIRDMERPVVGPPAPAVRLRALLPADAPWVGTTLQGLDAPRADARSVSACAPVLPPSTRAAAGHRQPAAAAAGRRSASPTRPPPTAQSSRPIRKGSAHAG